MRIARSDRQSVEWLRIREQMVARRDDLRRENDIDKTPEATAKLRGRIAELSAWIDADQDEPLVPDEPPPA